MCPHLPSLAGLCHNEECEMTAILIYQCREFQAMDMSVGLTNMWIFKLMYFTSNLSSFSEDR